ncbi:MAG: 4a-hydroxytetrahydrobiopterin dehydratase [Balneolaceae bacterium]
MNPLTEDEIRNKLEKDLEEWSWKGDKIHRTFRFKDFREAITFLMRVGFLAEAQQHHPEIFNVYNRVTISLCTHDAGDKVTEKDLKLAEAIEAIRQ